MPRRKRPDFEVKAGDTAPTFHDQLERDGEVIDLANADRVEFFMQNKETGDLLVNAVATIENPSTGAVSYTFADGETAQSGINFAEWVIHWSDGSAQTVPPDRNLAIVIAESTDRQIAAADITDADVSVTTLYADEIRANTVSEVGVYDPLEYQDDVKTYYGTGGDVSARYDSTADAYVIEDEVNAAQRLRISRTGPVEVPNNDLKVGAAITDGTNTIWDATNAVVGTDTVDTGAIQTDAVTGAELDQTVTPTWTGHHTFDAGLSLNDGDRAYLGTGDDVSVRYDSTQDAFVFEDEVNATERLRVGRTGPVEVQNASLVANGPWVESGGNGFRGASSTTRLRTHNSASTDDLILQSFDGTNFITNLQISGGGPVKVQNAALDISSGADGLKINSTAFLTEGSNARLVRTGGKFLRFFDTTNAQDLMRINEGGPVEVRNANLDLTGGAIVNSGNQTFQNNAIRISSASNRIRFQYFDSGASTFRNLLQIHEGGPVGVRNANLHLNSHSNQLIWNDGDGDGNRPGIYVNSNGEVVARDDAGNTTVLTNL